MDSPDYSPTPILGRYRKDLGPFARPQKNCVWAALDRLHQEVLPRVPWVVVLDGRPDDVEHIVQEVWRRQSETRVSWIASGQQEKFPDTWRDHVVRFNADHAEDKAIVSKIVADLVVVTSGAGIERRVSEWLRRGARYILAEGQPKGTYPERVIFCSRDEIMAPAACDLS